MQTKRENKSVVKQRKWCTLASWRFFMPVVAVLAVGLGVVARFLLDPLLGSHSPFITFFPAIALAVFVGRAGAGLLATFLSMLSANYFFFAPRFKLGTAGTTDATIVAAFLFGAGVIIFLGEAMHAARDRAEASRSEAQAAEEKARQIVETANEGIWMLDNQARVILVNPRLCEMLGYTAEEMIGRFKWEFLFSEDIPAAKTLYERRQRGISEQIDLRFCSKRGEEIWMLMAARARFDRAGRFVGALDMFTDISERKRLERELENKVKERTIRLQEVVDELEVFSYSIAHDLRAPLRAMQGLSMALVEDYAESLPAQATDYLQRIASSASLLDRQILNILEYNHLLSGELPLEVVDLDCLIREILASNPNFQERREGIHLLNEIPVVLGNRTALRQVVSNLLSNAVKFVPRDKSPEVRIWSETNDGVVRLWFKDNGIGISKKGQQKIFRLFQRLQSQDDYEGTGIGLAIVKKAIERMGGQVGVNSEPGRGSEFWVELRKAILPLVEQGANFSEGTAEELEAKQASGLKDRLESAA